jgi:uncharacterized protein YjbJ (UPF0337 family)
MKSDGISEQLIPNIFFLLKRWDSMNHHSGVHGLTWEDFEGTWREYRGRMRAKWRMLTDDDVVVIAGKRDQLLGRLQERYGIAQAEAAEEADAFLMALSDDAGEVSKVSRAARRR